MRLRYLLLTVCIVGCWLPSAARGDVSGELPIDNDGPEATQEATQEGVRRGWHWPWKKRATAPPANATASSPLMGEAGEAAAKPSAAAKTTPVRTTSTTTAPPTTLSTTPSTTTTPTTPSTTTTATTSATTASTTTTAAAATGAPSTAPPVAPAPLPATEGPATAPPAAKGKGGAGKDDHPKDDAKKKAADRKKEDEALDKQVEASNARLLSYLFSPPATHAPKHNEHPSKKAPHSSGKHSDKEGSIDTKAEAVTTAPPRPVRAYVQKASGLAQTAVVAVQNAAARLGSPLDFREAAAATAGLLGFSLLLSCCCLRCLCRRRATTARRAGYEEIGSPSAGAEHS